MWYRPSKINLGFDDLTTAKSENLCIAKPPATNRTSFIGHENSVAMGQEVDELEPLYLFTVRPAVREIRHPVDAIVKRTEIGRASCRERVQGWLVRGAV